MSEQGPNNRERLIEFIAATVETMREQMVTKSDLGQVAGDVARVEQKLDAGLVAVRGDIERVALRLNAIDRSVSLRVSAVEAEVSRLRSVVYLLVKDQPDLLRLLGNEPHIS
jgi:hypothetical protein